MMINFLHPMEAISGFNHSLSIENLGRVQLCSNVEIIMIHYSDGIWEKQTKHMILSQQDDLIGVYSTLLCMLHTYEKSKTFDL